jgi:hypothetical protein
MSCSQPAGQIGSPALSDVFRQFPDVIEGKPVDGTRVSQSCLSFAMHLAFRACRRSFQFSPLSLVSVEYSPERLNHQVVIEHCRVEKGIRMHQAEIGLP